MRVAPVTLESFINAGRDIQNHPTALSIKTEDRKFRSFFGTCPEVCLDVWNRLKPYDNVHVDSKPKHLLWGSMLIKVYATDEALSSLAKADEKTFPKWAWKFIVAVSDVVTDQVIDLENRFRGDIGNQCKLSLDGTHYRCQKQKKPLTRKYWSWKF